MHPSTYLLMRAGFPQDIAEEATTRFMAGERVRPEQTDGPPAASRSTDKIGRTAFESQVGQINLDDVIEERGDIAAITYDVTRSGVMTNGWKTVVCEAVLAAFDGSREVSPNAAEVMIRVRISD